MAPSSIFFNGTCLNTPLYSATPAPHTHGMTWRFTSMTNTQLGPVSVYSSRFSVLPWLLLEVFGPGTQQAAQGTQSCCVQTGGARQTELVRPFLSAQRAQGTRDCCVLSSCTDSARHTELLCPSLWAKTARNTQSCCVPVCPHRQRMACGAAAPLSVQLLLGALALTS
jgi:hypothetical protein